MKILITGGNFNNKGAQTMLFVTASELLAHYPGAEIYYSALKAGKGRTEIYRFRHLYKSAMLAALGKKSGAAGFFDFHYAALETLARGLMGQKCSLKDISRYQRMLEGVDLIVDISGYSLSSRFANGHIPGAMRYYRQTTQYLNVIGYAKALNIPVILLPQSFGPFDYGRSRAKLLRRISELLAYPKLIFAREEYAFTLLRDTCGLTNVQRSDDLVLQYKQIRWDLITEGGMPDMSVPEIPGEHNVAIIPNGKVMAQVGNDEAFYALYAHLIAHLREKGKQLWLIWHSGEDLRICREIARRCPDVHVIEQELAFYQYEQVIGHFEYAIASRFHSIVHAYRHGVPCVSLGWAEKYESLAESCGQREYVVPCDRAVTDPEELLRTVDRLDSRFRAESETIRTHVRALQEDNCFDRMFALLDQKKPG